MSHAVPTPQHAGRPGAPAVYSYRRHAFGNESGWTLGPAALVRAEAGAPARQIAYADVEELRLSFDPTRFDRNRYRCDVRAKNGARLTILSTSYISVGNFEDRGGRYAPFVRGLVARVAQASPHCRFRSGKTPVAYWLQHIVLLAALILLASALAVVGGLPPMVAIAVKLAVIAFYIPLALRYARRNFPRGFTADRIPPEMLP
ncbi:MAG: hypothetical protein FJX62_02660 [Alphaproteobacteria bacterium]|nr:hypothetical protein [Alphaproteobacteria bacterium]